MATELRVKRMRLTLIVAGLISLIYWGVLLVFVTPGMTGAYGAPYPAEPIYVRTIGMVCVVLGLLFLLASRDPVKNRIAVDIGIINWALMLIFAFVSMFITKEAVGFVWGINLVLYVVFLILFIAFRPKTAET